MALAHVAAEGDGCGGHGIGVAETRAPKDDGVVKVNELQRGQALVRDHVAPLLQTRGNKFD